MYLFSFCSSRLPCLAGYFLLPTIKRARKRIEGFGITQGTLPLSRLPAQPRTSGSTDQSASTRTGRSDFICCPVSARNQVSA
jgi:hypothetical protein